MRTLLPKDTTFYPWDGQGEIPLSLFRQILHHINATASKHTPQVPVEALIEKIESVQALLRQGKPLFSFFVCFEEDRFLEK